jgi:hypothetical protein
VGIILSNKDAKIIQCCTKIALEMYITSCRNLETFSAFHIVELRSNSNKSRFRSVKKLKKNRRQTPSNRLGKPRSSISLAIHAPLLGTFREPPPLIIPVGPTRFFLPRARTSSRTWLAQLVTPRGARGGSGSLPWPRLLAQPVEAPCSVEGQGA